MKIWFNLERSWIVNWTNFKINWKLIRLCNVTRKKKIRKIRIKKKIILNLKF